MLPRGCAREFGPAIAMPHSPTTIGLMDGVGTRQARIRHADQAFNAETPVHALDDALTPHGLFFVRNNGTEPEGPFDPAAWSLSIEGLVERPFTVTAADLAKRFPVVEVTSVLECAGNGRSMLAPKADGVPWGLGAVGCARFTGVRLADLLTEAGVRPAAFYTAHHGTDRTLDGSRPALSRGLPIAKALAPETLVAFAMNGQPLAAEHGACLRIVAPGFPGSAWQKWLTRITVRDVEHDGARMTGLDYRLPRVPVVPGDPIDARQFDVITRMPVRALATWPAEGTRVPAGAEFEVAGWAWAHGRGLASVELQVEGSERWQAAVLAAADPANPFAWQRFSGRIAVAMPGDFTLRIRATEADGSTQPLTGTWNPKGYCNNACQSLRLVAI
jgi:sulfite oxidase